MRTAQGDMCAALPVMVGQRVGAVRRRDVDLNGHQVRLIVEAEVFDVLILDRDFVVWRKDTRPG
jgi:hypothetical protein